MSRSGRSKSFTPKLLKSPARNKSSRDEEDDEGVSLQRGSGASTTTATLEVSGTPPVSNSLSPSLNRQKPASLREAEEKIEQAMSQWRETKALATTTSPRMPGRADARKSLTSPLTSPLQSPTQSPRTPAAATPPPAAAASSTSGSPAAASGANSASTSPSGSPSASAAATGKTAASAGEASEPGTPVVTISAPDDTEHADVVPVLGAANGDAVPVSAKRGAVSSPVLVSGYTPPRYINSIRANTPDAIDLAASAIEQALNEWRTKKSATPASASPSGGGGGGSGASPRATSSSSSDDASDAAGDSSSSSSPNDRSKNAKRRRSLSLTHSLAKSPLSAMKRAKEAVVAPGSSSDSSNKKAVIVDGDDESSSAAQHQQPDVCIQVDQYLKSHGIRGVSDTEKKWLMRTLAEGGNTMNDSALAAGAAPIKKAKKSRKQLFFELEETKSELEKLRRTHTLVSQERDRLRSEVEGLNDRVEDLEHKRIESNRLNAELSIRLEAMQAHTEARDKDVESMEQRLLSKVNELSKSESELSKKLKQSLASQSRLEQQMIELRGTRSNAEQERSDLSKNLSHTKHELEKMRHDLKHLRTDNRQLKEENDTMKAKVQRATEALVNAREYIRTLEISDTQIRTAIAVVQKQNRTLAAFNSTLKAELGEAKAQLAMQLALEQQYDQLEDDQLPDLGVDESDLIACGIAPPPPPNPNDPTSFVTYNLLSVIPNPVAARKKEGAPAVGFLDENKPAQEEPTGPVTEEEVVSAFTKALLLRRARFGTEEGDDEDDENWDE